MKEIAQATVAFGLATEAYSLNRLDDGGLVLDCRRWGASEGIGIYIPTGLIPWLGAAVSLARRGEAL
jgi:hypothetical protein